MVFVTACFVVTVEVEGPVEVVGERGVVAGEEADVEGVLFEGWGGWWHCILFLVEEGCCTALLSR